MPHFSQICFYTCQICFCTGVPFQTFSHWLSTSSYRSSLWSHNCPSRSLTSQLLWKPPLWPLKEHLLDSWNMDERLTVTISMLFLVSHQTLLICGVSPLLERSLVLASFVPLERSCVTPEPSGRKKRSAFMFFTRKRFFVWRQHYASTC